MSKLIASFLFCAALCSASSITYNVNLIVGNGSVTGQIVTDGTLGVLGPADSHIIDFDLLISDSAGSDELTGPLSGGNAGFAFFGGGSGLSATETELFYDFSPGNYNLLFRVDINGSGGSFICFQQNSECPGASNGIVVGVGDSSSSFDHRQFSPLTGSQIIATTAAPEPSTLTLLGAGFGLLGFAKSRKNRR